MAAENLHSILLNDLAGRLKNAGYPLTVAHMLDVQALFLSVSFSELNIAELKYLLAPMIAKTKEEQEEVYAVIDTYIAEKTAKYQSEVPLPMHPAPPVAFYALPKSKSLFELEPNLMKLILGMAVIVILAVIGGTYLYDNSFQNIPVTETFSSDTALADTAGKTMQANAPVKPIPRQDSTAAGFMVEGLHPFEPKEKNVNMQLSIILGLIAGVVVSFLAFRVREEDYKTADNATKAATNNPGGNQGASPAAETATTPAAHLPAMLHFGSNNHLITDDAHTLVIKKNMLKYGVGTTFQFNVVASITASVQTAGFQNPVFSYKKEQQRFLVLMPVAKSANLIHHLFGWWLHSLEKAGVYIEKYFYSNNIFTLSDGRNSTFSLKEIAYAKAGFNLLVIRDSRPPGEWDTQAISERAGALFAAWPNRILITERLPGDWTSTEYHFEQSGFCVTPAETYTVSAAIKTITGAQTPARKSTPLQMAECKPLGNIEFNTAADVEAFLNDEALLQMVCALAIHPVVQWPVTVALYDALVKHGSSGGDFNNLLKISRMPFIKNEVLPAGLRASLLRRMYRKTEVAAREVLLAMLQQAAASVQNGGALQQLQEQMRLHEFFLFACERKEFKKFEPAKRAILATWRSLDDNVMKEYAASGSAKLLPAKPGGNYMTVEEFMVQEKSKEVTRVNVLRIATTLVPGILIYLFLIIFKPPFAYPKGSEMYGNNAVTVVFKKDSCSRSVDSVKFTGNNVDSNFVIHPDSTVLYNMEYDIPVMLQYRYRDLDKTTSIDCTDSLYIVHIINCR